jgi:hypothetical protein
VEAIRGNVEAVKQEPRQVSTSVSALQQINEGLAVIKNRLSPIDELGEKGSLPEYNDEQVAEMHDQLSEIIESIEQAADNTADKYKRLFIGKCANTSLATGDGSQIDIFAKDLIFGATGVDLTSEASGAMVTRAQVDPDKTVQLLQEASVETGPEDTVGRKQSAAMEGAVDSGVKVGREADDTPNKCSERADIGT